MNRKQENKDNSAEATRLIEALSRSFRPAPDAEHATHRLTTQEVFAALKQINPASPLLVTDVHDAMIDAGYWYQNRPGAISLSFRWMLQAIPETPTS